MIKKHLTAVLIVGTCAMPAAAKEPCIDLRASQAVELKGTLTRQIFAGPPNYEDVRRGDRPEPRYILELPKPICVIGDEFIDQNTPINRVQIFPDYAERENKTLARELRRLIGKVVVVQGGSPFGAHTGHHHAPLLLPITNITIASRN